jgi:hypothetical protein
MTTDTDTKQDTIQRPADRWLNWFKALEPAFHIETGDRKNAGEVYAGEIVYPTKDLAESEVAKAMPIAVALYGRPWVEYLGAYPEGTRP